MTYANARDLAERIEAGERPDAFASPSETHPRRLHAAGLLSAPRPFATNRLVMAVRRDSAATAAEALASRLAIEVAGVPLGDYTRALFARLGITQPDVAFEETIVDAVADRVLCGDADAGVLYATDVAARAPRLRALELPVQVAVTLFAGSLSAAGAAWVEDLVAGPPALREAGFGPPPGQNA